MAFLTLRKMAFLVLGLAFFAAFSGLARGDIDCSSEAACTKAAEEFLTTYEVDGREIQNEAFQAEWEYNVDINDVTEQASLDATAKKALFDKNTWKENVNLFNLSMITDPTMRRQIQKMSVLGKAALPDEDFGKLSQAISNMVSTYGSAKICPYDNQDCDLETEGLTLEGSLTAPGIEDIISDAPNRDYDELTYAWKKWRDVSGKQMVDDYEAYIKLYNQAAEANGLASASELWLNAYTADTAEDVDFRQDMEDLWQQLEPLYKDLHAYIRWKYSKKWGKDKVDLKKPIPAHITGNMWAQEWGNTYSIVTPFPEASSALDQVTENMQAKKLEPLDIFVLSDDFYKLLGLEGMDMCYTTTCDSKDTPTNRECYKSQPLIVKPEWDVVCHASAWDMFSVKRDDYRIKMCTGVNFEDLVTVHHEMGHIEYFIQYKDKEIQFRDSANPGFHEAIGDTMALAVQTPAHLKSIGLLADDIENSPEADINYLMKAAMDKVMFLPFGYLIDKYRWALFDGDIEHSEMNKKWWDMREKYQGLAPPVPRSEDDFDAGAKYHVAADVPYIRYFIAQILQFQFYKQMCLESKQYDPKDPGTKPLFKCDFSAGEPADVAEAGKNMKNLLMAGSSKPWPQIMDEYTGSRKIDASALLEYFAPLTEYLEKEIKDNDIPVGWNEEDMSSAGTLTVTTMLLLASLLCHRFW